MKQLKKIYQKYYEVITKYIFPVILFLYPFVTVNQGVDVSDSTYSFSNFLFFEQMEGRSALTLPPSGTSAVDV